MNALIEKVKSLGHEKNILGEAGQGTLDAQSKKMIEAANNTLVALSQYIILANLPTVGGEVEDIFEQQDRQLFSACIGGVGETLITLILLAEMLGTDINHCLEHGYNTISKGKITDFLAD